MGEAYTFTGHTETGFPDYRDAATGRMLTAQPGESCRIEAVDGKLPVPPPGGHWEPAATGWAARAAHPTPPQVTEQAEQAAKDGEQA